ncbi:hypothetical protein I6F35_10710 [Bradyrhizobium sp. BRP22]|uniref:hypothetical protein n=1 Tax=Bradyrhizobium sp. BRP22 TaxID=2793821 RepID=UPI001CD30519|nr:hypothetical protein [Bradyrhizobium sp. BRP22]MCA1453681.1 hypothetical protein [Bradyrhizobium sp. BRP22]
MPRYRYHGHDDPGPVFLIIVEHHRCSTVERRNNVVFDRFVTSKQSNRSYPIGLLGQLSEAHIQTVFADSTEQTVYSEGAPKIRIPPQEAQTTSVHPLH